MASPECRFHIAGNLQMSGGVNITGPESDKEFGQRTLMGFTRVAFANQGNWADPKRNRLCP
jgi:hypothetical protein